MTDPISGVSGRPSTLIKSEQSKNDATSVRSDGSEVSRLNDQIDRDEDRVELSSEARVELDKAGFDAEKVDRIKQALADGNYPVDAKRIAEGFSDIEKLL